MLEFPLILGDIPGRLYWLIAMIGIPLLLFIIVQIIRLPNRARLKFLAFRQWSVVKIAENSTYPPVLYLRPFNADGIRSTYRVLDFSKFKFKINLGKMDVEFSEVNFEYQLEKKAEKIGPFIAFGNPKKSYNHDFGAAREFHTHDEWKEKALEKMNKSSIILMRPSYSLGPSGLWEMEQLINNYLKKTIFFIESKKGFFQGGLINRLQAKCKNLPNLNRISLPCYLEFLDDDQISISKNISQTSLYRQLYRLSKLNKHYMYCANCGEANQTDSAYCVTCGQSLHEQKVHRVKKRSNPLISIITGDSGFFLIAFLFLSSTVLWYWFQQKVDGTNPAYSSLLKVTQIISLGISIAIWLIMIFFTVKVWRQIVILMIALLLIGYSVWGIFR